MGARLKYIIPFLLIVLGLFAFQNCDERALQANGDPYENQDIQLDDGYLDSPDHAAQTQLIPGFVREQLCERQSAEAQIYALQLGTHRGSDAVVVQLADGRYKVSPWPNGTSPLVLNQAITNELTVISIELINNSTQALVQFKHNDASLSETLNCQ